MKTIEVGLTENAHRYAEMIWVKAANMELTVFACVNGEWYEPTNSDLGFFEGHDNYFLCLPKHKEACLHWLNGGVVQDFTSAGWVDLNQPRGIPEWSNGHVFMDDSIVTRIAPKKEKRWIPIRMDKNDVGLIFQSYDECRAAYKFDAWQIIEIEVEV